MKPPPEIANIAGLERAPLEDPVIYFLCLDGRVVYVGQTVDLRTRLRAHTDKVYDDVYFIRCPKEQLSEMEAKFIRELEPPLNHVHMPPGAVRKREAEAAVARWNEVRGRGPRHGWAIPSVTRK